MSASQAKRLVVLAVIVSGGLAAVAQLSKGRAPSVRLIVGGFVTAVLLGVATEFAPEVAGRLAALMIATSVFVLGAPAWEALNNLTAQGSNP